MSEGNQLVEESASLELEAPPEIDENELGLGILDTLQKNLSVHVALDLVGRFLLSYMFTKNKDLLKKENYELWDFATPKDKDGETVDSSIYTIGTTPIAGHVGGRQYPLSVLSQAKSLSFKALISDIKEAVETCVKKKPVGGTVRLIVNVTDKGMLSITLMFTYKDVS